MYTLPTVYTLKPPHVHAPMYTLSRCPTPRRVHASAGQFVARSRPPKPYPVSRCAACEGGRGAEQVGFRVIRATNACGLEGVKTERSENEGAALAIRCNAPTTAHGTRRARRAGAHPFTTAPEIGAMTYRHDHYNRERFPLFVVNHGPWDIHANAAGYCAAIPTEEAAATGHLASHFGDLAYVRTSLGRYLTDQGRWAFAWPVAAPQLAKTARAVDYHVCWGCKSQADQASGQWPEYRGAYAWNAHMHAMSIIALECDQ